MYADTWVPTGSLEMVSIFLSGYAVESTNSSLTNCKDNKINILSGYAESQVEMLVYNMKSVQLFGFILAGCVLKKWASLKVNNYEIWKLKLNIY